MSEARRLATDHSPDSGVGPVEAPAEAPEPESARRRGPGPRGGALPVLLWALRTGPAVMLALAALAAALSTPLFLTTQNIGNVLDASATIAVLGIGQLLVIITRGIDLSVGSTLALASVVGALAVEHHHGGAFVIAAMLATGVAVGVVKGTSFLYR